MLTNFLIGVTGSLITLFLAPFIQNHFWHYQRRSEVQLKTIEQLNNLAAQLIQGCIKNPGFAVDENFHRNLSIVDGQIIALFSPESYDAYKKFERLVSSQGSNSPVHEIVEARNVALKALYDEVTGSRFLKAIGHASH